jgi:hypothetical protein
MSDTLDAGNIGVTYFWNNSAISQQLVVNTPGMYWVQVTDTNNCLRKDTIILSLAPVPTVFLGSDTSICPGTSIWLDAGWSFTSYYWSDASSGQGMPVTGAGSYWVEVTNAWNCKGSDTIFITQDSLPSIAGINVTFTGGNSYQFAPVTPQHVTNYLWFFGDGVTATASSPTHTYNNAGTYNVTLLASNNCGVDSVFQTVVVTAINDLLEGTAAVYPNPADNILHIELSGGDLLKEVRLYTIDGRLALSHTYSEKSKAVIDISTLAAGNYLLKALSDKQIVSQKVTVR